jgi:hypothetical protein
MVSKCANPNCSERFRYLHVGKLFRIEKPPAAIPSSLIDGAGAAIPRKPGQSVEFFWLCETCAEKMTVTCREGVGVQIIPLAKAFRQAS